MEEQFRAFARFLVEKHLLQEGSSVEAFRGLFENFEEADDGDGFDLAGAWLLAD